MVQKLVAVQEHEARADEAMAADPYPTAASFPRVFK